MKKEILESIRVIKKEKYFIYSSAFLMLSFSILGYLLAFFDFVPNKLVNYLLDYIEQIILQTQNFNSYQLISFIFFNNSLSCFFAIFYSSLFGFFSIFSSILNGFLIGFVSNMVISSTGNFFSLWQLLPHGIFEIPAVLISMGLGISFGFKVLERKFKIKKIFHKIVVALILVTLFCLLFIYIPYVVISLALFFGSLLFFIFVILYDKFLKKEFYGCMKVYFFVVIPLLVIASIIEGLLIVFLR